MLGPLDFWVWGSGGGLQPVANYRRGRGVVKFGISGIEHQIEVSISDGNDARLTFVGVDSHVYGDRVQVGRTVR